TRSRTSCCRDARSPINDIVSVNRPIRIPLIADSLSHGDRNMMRVRVPPNFSMSASIPNAQQRILLIDDDELIAGSLRCYLAKNGCEVDVALDAPEAERLMKSGRYDVIVVDPYLTGGIYYDSGVLIDTIARLQQGAAVIV